jgi:putative molybdopterin biosynthesis protein
MRFVQEELLRAKGASEIRLQGSARSHSAVAAAVAAGRVNLGICARAAAERAGLAFSTIGEEEIDFLVAPDRLDRMAVRRFLEALRSEELKKLLPSGFRLHEDTGRMIK